MSTQRRQAGASPVLGRFVGVALRSGADQPNRLTWRHVVMVLGVATLLIWISAPIGVLMLLDPDMVVILFAWMAVLITFMLAYCGLMAGAVSTVARLGRLLRVWV